MSTVPRVAGGTGALEVRRVPGLPARAWCATVARGAAPVEVVAGDLVEVSPGAFFEGVWDGPFADLGFTRSPAVMGSGALVTDDGVHVCGPSHLFDSLYSRGSGDRCFVSNSLPVLLACAGDTPDHRYVRYRADFARLWRRGIAASPLAVPTAAGGRVLVHAGTDLVIGRDLSVERREKPQPPEPCSFAHYRDTLSGTVARLVENARDPTRRTTLAAATTLSSGYDSGASAVLGAEAGIERAYSIVRHDDPDHDRGTAVAEHLGLHVTDLSADAWRSMRDDPVVEFVASARGPLAISLAALDGPATGSMVLMGSLGDDLWARHDPGLHDRFAMPTAGIWSPWAFHDFALRAGIVIVHVPAIGATHAEAIHRISTSDEMQPWATSGWYDRPIPRRILEEAGVPRAAVGVRKLATAVPADVALAPRAGELAAFWREVLADVPRRSRARLRLEALTIPAVLRATSPVTRRVPKIRARPLARWLLERNPRDAYRFHWAVETLIGRARDALGGTRAARQSSLPARDDLRAREAVGRAGRPGLDEAPAPAQ